MTFRKNIAVLIALLPLGQTAFAETDHSVHLHGEAKTEQSETKPLNPEHEAHDMGQMSHGQGATFTGRSPISIFPTVTCSL